MSSRRSALMIIGTLMALETCLILGHVSHNLLYWKKNLRRIYVVRGEINEKAAYIQAGSSMTRTLNGKARQTEGKAKSGLRKSSSLETHENCEGSVSLTGRRGTQKKPSRTRVRSWKHQWLLLCTVKLRKIVGVVHPTKFRQNLRVFWKLMNPQECVWETRYHQISKTILQEQVNIHCSIAIWFTSLFPCLKLWKFRQRQQRWTRNGKNWRKFRRGTWRKSKVRKVWSMKQGPRAPQFILHH